MAHKRSLAKKTPDGIKNYGADTPLVRQLVTEVQKNLRAGNYDEAYSGACRLDDMLKDKTDKPHLRDIRLTSLIWKIRARQGARASDEEVLGLVRRYCDASMEAGDAERVCQAMKIEAQIAVSAGEWIKAEEILVKTAEIRMKLGKIAEYAEILSDVAGMQISQCHFNDALETLNLAMDAIDKIAGGAIADYLEMSVLKQYHDIYEQTGDDESAVQVLDVLAAGVKGDVEHAGETAYIALLIYHRHLKRNRFKLAAEMLSSVSRMIEHDDESAPEVRALRTDVIMLEQAEYDWQTGARRSARALVDMIESSSCSASIARAAAMTRYQWAIEAGKPGDDPDRAAERAAACIGKDADIPLKLALQLANAELMLERGQYDEADEILHHVEETADFLMLAPIMTRAKAMRITVCRVRGKYAEATALSEDVFQAFSGFGNVVDICAAFMTCLNLHLKHPGVIWLAAAPEQVRDDFMAAKDGFLDDARQVLDDALSENNVEGAAAIGLEMMYCDLLRNDTDSFDRNAERLRPVINAGDAAHREMMFLRLCAMRHNGGNEGKTAEENARRIAEENGFYWRDDF